MIPPALYLELLILSQFETMPITLHLRSETKHLERRSACNHAPSSALAFHLCILKVNSDPHDHTSPYQSWVQD